MEQKVYRYYVWDEYGRNDDCFDNIPEAIEFAKEHGYTEVEETIWSDEDAYNFYEPAIECNLIWKRRE